MAYGFISTVLALVLIFYYGPRYGKVNILIYIAICSLIGSISVMGCKGVGIVLKQTFNHKNQFDNPVSWALIFVVCFCGTTQINYLNKALDIFNTSLVTPIYYVMFTTLTIIASAILFQEWEFMHAEDVIGTFCGFLTIILGVFLLHAFKDIKFSVHDLQFISKSRGRENGVTVHENSETIRLHNVNGSEYSSDEETTHFLTPSNSGHV